ncbi:AAA domain-containing protein [Paenibacillus xylaniclasticus]|uniref:AAA domain-containing protein n=1 Tax=Paenibacillus xylaniclasticus TaxID=588083 RepID=UPI000FD84EA5|nr:AAA domain-containing protein [Paenibacillus xylaniclasticus]
MNIIHYWRNSLADADRLSPDVKEVKKAALQIHLDYLKVGRIPDDITLKLFEKESKKDEINTIQVLLCPIISYLKVEHSKSKGNHPAILIPLWIPALLNKGGNLLVPPHKIPWIPRDYLDPCLGSVYPIGTLRAMDRFLSAKPFQFEAWNLYWSHAIKMFEEVTDISFGLFEHEQYAASKESYIMLDKHKAGAATYVQKLYDHIIETKPALRLLRHLASLEDQPYQLALPLELSTRTASRHIGQMGQQHLLSDSQRQSLHHWLHVEEGEMLALNGPPGTGKTTFLQSVIATAWVKAALKQAEPPIMVVTSSNNQPVTNVIESFTKIQELPNHPLAGRWIPQIEGYGSYLASSSKKDKELKSHWQTIKMDSREIKNGLLSSMENLDDVSKAAYTYLDNVTRYSNRSFEKVEDAVAYLHQCLTQCNNRMEHILKSIEQLHKYEAEFTSKYPEGITVFMNHAVSQLTRYRTQQSRLEQLRSEWVSHIAKGNWLVKCFSFVPFVKKIKIRRDREFLKSVGIDLLKNDDEVNAYFRSEIMSLQQKISEVDESLRGAREDEEQLSQSRKEWEVCSNQLIDDISIYFPEDEIQSNSNNELNALLDRTLRYEMFKLAVHYWEGRWILETRDMLNDPNYKTNKGVKSQQKLWRRYAKLTPCFVTTLFMLPAFFKAWQGSDQYLYEFIDTLIIDEAGQVTPELAAASFALAKKALIVGDILQIEPVWNIPFAIDDGNLLQYELAKDKQKAYELQEKGITASSGSVMLIARRKTKFSLSPSEGGMWLVEHRRCVPEIINFCNELAYHGRLQAKRPSLLSYPLPHLGYAHVPGEAKKKHGSLLNEIEADAIVSWIHRNQELLTKPYIKKGSTPLGIDKVVAIITPFYQQKRLILEKLEQTGLKSMKSITVGTVHALQGAERPVIIFSPVYDGNHDGSLFFDSGVNLLNVAVSRAQDSFLVFGDMSNFDPASNKPSGVLARYLFASEEQEIQNVEMPLYFKTRLASPVDHIHDLQGHRSMLTQCIRTANREVHIVSPFLSANALIADGLQSIFEDAVRRGVKIVVYTDEALNLRNGLLLPHFIKAKEMLSAWGVNVVRTSRVHSKALWIDQDMLIEGSFNWLSAVRQANSRWCRYETSLIFRGDKVRGMIDQIKLDLEKRRIEDKNK